MTYSIRKESVERVIPILDVLIQELDKKTKEFVLPLRDEISSQQIIYRIREGIYVADKLNMEPYNRLKEAYKMGIVKGGIRFRRKAEFDFTQPIEVLPINLTCTHDVRSFDDIIAWLASVDPKDKVDEYVFKQFNLPEDEMETFFKWVVGKGLHVSKSGSLVTIAKGAENDQEIEKE